MKINLNIICFIPQTINLQHVLTSFPPWSEYYLFLFLIIYRLFEVLIIMYSKIPTDKGVEVLSKSGICC